MCIRDSYRSNRWYWWAKLHYWYVFKPLNIKGDKRWFKSSATLSVYYWRRTQLFWQILNQKRPGRLGWKKIDLYNESLPPLKEFILPSGSIEIATCHLARAICRRAERRVVAYYSDNNKHNDLLAYINRLSDLLFVYCRKIAAADLVEEKYWNPSI